MKRLTAVKCWFLFPFIVMTLMGCQDDEMEGIEEEMNDELDITSPAQYFFTAGSLDYSAVADNEIVWSNTSFSEDGSEIRWSSSITEDEGLGIAVAYKIYNLDIELTDDQFSYLFLPEEKELSSDGETGFSVLIGSPTLGEYSTDLGDQTDSYFEILDRQEEYLQGSFYVKVHCAFSCKVYSEDNPEEYIEIVDGEFVNYFANWQ